MPDGVVQWFDPATGDAAIVRAGRVYAATGRDMESAARHPGARVHFDIDHETGAARAVNVADRIISGRSRIRAALETSGLVGAEEVPDVRGADGTVSVTWTHLAGGGPGRMVRCRVEHGLIAEQWIGPVSPVSVQPGGVFPIEVSIHGQVEAGAVDYARRRIERVIDHIDAPVLFARMKLGLAADPARRRPASAQAALDIDGEMIRAHVAAHEPLEAADLLQRRLYDKLEQRASRRRELRRRSGLPEPGEWRHGDLPANRHDFYDRPVEERELVRHKTFALDELTADEAAFDMGRLDYDFHLFRDLTSGEDAVLEHLAGNTYRLTRLHPVDLDPGPTAISLTIAKHPPPAATVHDALARLNAGGEPFVFFENSDTGRGNVVYRRYDGHYGLITPE